MEERSREDVESVNNKGRTVMEKGRQHGKQLHYRESCNQSHNGKKGGWQDKVGGGEGQAAWEATALQGIV